LTNYYEILGLHYGATIAEVKTSFRQLAKMYHPDLNPEGLDYFSKVLKAYETLSDPSLKQAYDYKLQYHQAQNEHQRTAKSTKVWRFDERELKRRQYYNEHIRKYAKESSGSSAAQASVKHNYNEFKYILFATPLAVILFLVIMTFANTTNHAVGEPPFLPKKQSAFVSEPKRFQTGDDPYMNLFGESRYVMTGGQKLIFKNLTGTDLVICIFTTSAFVRCFYMEDGYSAEVPQLPNEALYINYSSGKDFDPAKEIEGVNVSGAFTKNLNFYKDLKPLQPGAGEIVLTTNENNNFSRTDAKEFFKRVKR
jgi:curved DNA-binding protein CbpA